MWKTFVTTRRFYTGRLPLKKWVVSFLGTEMNFELLRDPVRRERWTSTSTKTRVDPLSLVLRGSVTMNISKASIMKIRSRGSATVYPPIHQGRDGVIIHIRDQTRIMSKVEENISTQAVTLAMPLKGNIIAQHVAILSPLKAPLQCTVSRWATRFGTSDGKISYVMSTAFVPVAWEIPLGS